MKSGPSSNRKVKDLARRFVPKLKPIFYLAAGDKKRIRLSQTLVNQETSPKSTEMVSKLLENTNFELVFRQGEKSRIPSVGPLVIVVNQPLAATDLLKFYQLVCMVRPDTKIYRHSLLKSFSGLSEIQVFPDAKHKRTSERLKSDTLESTNHNPMDHLKAGGVLIFTPAKSINRLGMQGLRDGRWSARFLKVARQAGAQIQTMHLDIGALFSVYSQGLGRRIMPNQFPVAPTSSHDVVVRVGRAIPETIYANQNLSNRAIAKLFRAETYRLAKDKESVFKQQVTSLAGPGRKELLKSELMHCEVLDKVAGMEVLLYRNSVRGLILDEIGRLRERTFVAIGEGTGRDSDTDEFDLDYDHIILWDSLEDSIAGAYRLKPSANHYIACDSSNDSNRRTSLYTETLFAYQESGKPILEAGLELGRSFVHPDYWGSRSLDYLWLGIAAYLRRRPYYRYLFGAVSISNTLSEEAKEVLVYYYQKYFSAKHTMVRSRRPFEISSEHAEKIEALFAGLDFREGFVELKRYLAEIGASVPMLYKQYTGLCGYGGVKFHGFSVDPGFSNCIDGFVVVDIDQMLPLKRKRYRLEGYPTAFIDQRQHA